MALALHLLGRHPDVQQRVRDEVAAVVGDRPVGVEDLARLTFTAQVLDETMRLYPPGHTLVRHAHEAATLDGQEVPAGHLVAVSVWGVHHNPDIWPDPERFDPDRFGLRGRPLPPPAVRRRPEGLHRPAHGHRGAARRRRHARPVVPPRVGAGRGAARRGPVPTTQRHAAVPDRAAGLQVLAACIARSTASTVWIASSAPISAIPARFGALTTHQIGPPIGRRRA